MTHLPTDDTPAPGDGDLGNQEQPTGRAPSSPLGDKDNASTPIPPPTVFPDGNDLTDDDPRDFHEGWDGDENDRPLGEGWGEDEDDAMRTPIAPEDSKDVERAIREHLRGKAGYDDPSEIPDDAKRKIDELIGSDGKATE